MFEVFDIHTGETYTSFDSPNEAWLWINEQWAPRDYDIREVSEDDRYDRYSVDTMRAMENERYEDGCWNFSPWQGYNR